MLKPSISIRPALWMAAKNGVPVYDVWELFQWLGTYRYILPADRVQRTDFICAIVSYFWPEIVPWAGTTRVSMIAEMLTNEEQKEAVEWLMANQKNIQ